MWGLTSNRASFGLLCKGTKITISLRGFLFSIVETEGDISPNALHLFVYMTSHSDSGLVRVLRDELYPSSTTKISYIETLTPSISECDCTCR